MAMFIDQLATAFILILAATICSSWEHDVYICWLCCSESAL